MLRVTPATRGAARRRLGVLISGRGSNLQAILESVAGELPRRDGCPGHLEHRRRRGTRSHAGGVGCPTLVIDHREFPTRAAFDAAVVAALRAHDVDLVCLAGFMRLLGPTFIAAFPQRDSQHPPVIAAGLPRTARAAAGVAARREGERRHGAPGRRRAGCGADRSAGGRPCPGRRHGRDVVREDPRRGAPPVSRGDCARARSVAVGRAPVHRRGACAGRNSPHPAVGADARRSVSSATSGGHR